MCVENFAIDSSGEQNAGARDEEIFLLAKNSPSAISLDLCDECLSSPRVFSAASALLTSNETVEPIVAIA